MNNLYTLLLKLKQRPELYLGEKSLFRLDSLILGYMLCQQDLNLNGNKLFDGFEDYIHAKYNIWSHNSSQIIRFYSITDSEAFDKFYELFETFLKDHPENLK